jgi:heme/copper-type cytochrome/quinol oxidase subunit 4
MTSTERPGPRGALPRRGVISAYVWLAGLTAVAIVLQALLAGEWLAGQNAIRVHEALGVGLFVLSLVLLVLAFATRVRGRDRRTLLTLSILLAVLMVVQVVLGLAGFDHANQARAFHLPNGLLLFGVSGAGAAFARRLSRVAGAS